MVGLTPFGWPGWLHLDGWQGRTKQPVIVVGETPKRYRIAAEQTTRLAGNRRYLEVGETALVPKTSVTKRDVP